MRHLFIYTVFLLSLISIPAKSQVAIEWQKNYGGTNSDFGECIQQTSDGGFIVLGFTVSSNGDVWGNHSPISGDFWVLKLDASGDTSWTKCYGGSGWENPSHVEQTSDGGYVFSGSTDSNNGNVSGHIGDDDYWILKTDATGNIQWQKCLGGSGTESMAYVRQTNDGGYIATGQVNSTDFDVTGNHGGWDAWVVKLDGSGAIQWKYCYGGTNTDGLYYAEQTTDGGYVLTGRTMSNDGDVSGNHGSMDVWTVKIDSAGLIQWQKCLGGTEWEESDFIQQTTNGGYIFTGETSSDDGDVTGFNGFVDQWTVKLDSVGNIEWQNSIGGSLADVGYAVRQVTDGGYIISGRSDSKDLQATGNKGDYDAWVVKLDSTGTYSWHKCFGGSTDESVESIWLTTDGNYIVAGYTASNDGDIIDNTGSQDVWIVKLTEDFNLITGQAYSDLNNNLVKDAGESAISDLQIFMNGNANFNFTNSSGNYQLMVVDTALYNISPDTNPYYLSNPLTHIVSFTGINQIDSLNDFAFQATGVFNDLKISLTRIGVFRPGFDATYQIHYENIGTTVLVPNIILIPDSSLDFVTSTPVPTNIYPDSISWDFLSLAPFESGTILVTVHVDSTLMMGDTVTSEASITPIIGDNDPVNNVEVLQTTLTTSLDPNNIIVSRDTMLSTEFPAPGYLEYIVNFQNTGNDTAFTVVVINNLPWELNEATYELIASSHPVALNYEHHSRMFSYTFNNILLPDSNTNEVMSHGFLRYRIKPVNSLVAGNEIENTAAIYFDFNEPVITNTALTEIVLPLSVNDIIDFSGNIKAYPNPFRNEFNVEIEGMNNQDVSVNIYDIYGRKVAEIYNGRVTTDKLKLTADFNTSSSGIYFIRARSGSEIQNVKIVKF